jgi:hypothetical protein
MSYNNRFLATDDLITHLTSIVTTITDTAIKANYAGFLSVSAVTVYELAIKDIFIEFASNKNKVFGYFIDRYFSRINGKITICDLKDKYIKHFGQKYFDNFEAKLKKRETIIFNTTHKELRTSYSNLILCRHEYVHRGTPTLTFEEVLDNYNIGKNVVHSLYDAMKR